MSKNFRNEKTDCEMSKIEQIADLVAKVGGRFYVEAEFSDSEGIVYVSDYLYIHDGVLYIHSTGVFPDIYGGYGSDNVEMSYRLDEYAMLLDESATLQEMVWMYNDYEEWKQSTASK